MKPALTPKYFNSLVQSLDYPVLVIDEKHEVLYLNDSAEELTGWDRDRVHGHFVGDILGLGRQACEKLWLGLPLEDAAEKSSWRESVCVLGKPANEAVRIKRKLLQLPDGKPAAVFVIHRLEGWEEHFEDVLAGSPVVFFEAGENGEFLHGAQQMSAILDMKAEALADRCLADLVVPEQRADFNVMWTQVFGGTSIRDRELCLLNGQGLPQHLWMSLFPLKDRQGEIKGVRGMAGDLAEQKGLAYALEAAEERFSVLFRESSDPILIISMQGEILSANPSFERISGVRSQDLFSGEKAWKDFVFEDDVSAVLDAVRRCAHQQQEGTVEFRMKSVDGAVWFEQSHSILHDEKGRPRGMMAVARDITQRKHREIKLRQEAETMHRRHQRAQELITGLTRFSTRINDLPADIDGFLSGVCDLLSEMYEPLYVLVNVPGRGLVASQKNAHLPAVLAGEHGDPKLSAMCVEVIEKGVTVYCNDLQEHETYAETPIVRKLGLQTYLGAPLRDSSGIVRGSLALFDRRRRDFDDMDIELMAVAALQVAARLKTEEHEDIRRDLENHLREAQKMEAVGMLAGGIAHDFNNILSGIMGFSSFLLSKVEKGTDTHRYLGLIEQSATRAADLTRQLLSFSRRTQFDKEPVSINPIIREVLELLEHSINENIVIQQDLSADLPSVLGDRGQFNQVVMNLCLNAAEAMNGLGGALRLATESRQLTAREKAVLHNACDSDYICLMVSDTGKGMKPEVREHIFDPFFTTKSGSGGTGLGLSIVYGIVSNHAGDITVTSTPGQGTMFRVYLPVYGEPVHKESEPAGRLGGTETIMIVDDEEIVREMVDEILKANGYTTICASSGEESVRLLKDKHKMDLVLLDMVMPGMDGEKTFHALKDMHPDISILLTSGFAQGDRCSSLIEQGARGLVKKPYRSEDLLANIRQVLG